MTRAPTSIMTSLVFLTMLQSIEMLHITLQRAPVFNVNLFGGKPGMACNDVQSRIASGDMSEMPASSTSFKESEAM